MNTKENRANEDKTHSTPNEENVKQDAQTIRKHPHQRCLQSPALLCAGDKRLSRTNYRYLVTKTIIVAKNVGGAA